jgi:hypothetical protein
MNSETTMADRYKIITPDSRFRGQVLKPKSLRPDGTVVLFTSVGPVPYYPSEVVPTTEPLTPLEDEDDHQCGCPMCLNELEN